MGQTAALEKVVFQRQVKDAIDRTAYLLGSADRWCQSNFAQDDKGEERPYWSAAACSWCMDGGIRRGVEDILPPFSQVMKLTHEVRRIVTSVIRNYEGFKGQKFLDETQDKNLIVAANDSEDITWEHVTGIFGIASALAHVYLKRAQDAALNA